MSGLDLNDKNIKINWRNEPDNVETIEHKKMVEEYLQKESEKRTLKRFFLPIAQPFIVITLIAILGAININLLGFLFLAILIVPLGFLILFFLIQWIIGKEKMNRYSTLIIFAILTILVVVCIVLSLYIH